MKTMRQMTHWLGLALACGALAFKGEAQAAETLNFTRLASWPGFEMGSVTGIHPIGSVVWLGLDCYKASNGALLALDVTNPNSTVVLSSTPTRGGIAWAFDNGFAYALSSSQSSSYIEVYDLADTRAPVLRGGTSLMQVNLGSWGTSLFASQDYLWLCTESGIETYDFRNPASPKRAGTRLWDQPQRPSQIVRVGNFGIVMTTDPSANTQYALHVFDLSNPAQPAETDVLAFDIGNTSGWPFLCLTALDDYVYYLTGSPLAGDYQSYLHAVKITSLGTIEQTAVTLRLTGQGNSHLCPVGDYLYFDGSTYDQATSTTKYWLRLMDVTTRLAPRILSSPLIYPPTWFWNQTAVDGRLYMALGGLGGGANGLFALDTTNPAQPLVLGTLWRTWKGLYGFVGGSAEPSWHARDPWTSHIRLLGTAGLLQGNPTPYREWNLPFVTGQSPSRDVSHVLLRSNYCYVLSAGVVYYPSSACWLDVYDLSGTGTPARKWSRQIFQQDDSWGLGGMYHTAKIDGNELYVSYWPGVMDIHSLTNPASPQFLSSVSVDLPDDLEIHNGYAYLFTATGNNSGGSIRRLEVVDVRDPANPSAMSIVREYTGVWHGTIAADGNLLYVVYFKNGSPNAIALDVFDLSEPLNPTRLSSTLVASTQYTAYDDIAIAKPYAFLAGGYWNSVLAVDISDPTQPKPLGTYNPFPNMPDYYGGGVHQVKSWQNHVVFQDESSGVVVVDVDVPLITRQPQSRTNGVGTTASFSVEASSRAPLSFQWCKDGTNLADGVKFAGVATTNLLVANVQPADAGGYSVVVTNAFGSVTSGVAQLTVTLPSNPGRFSNLSYSPETGLSFIFRDATVAKPYRIQVSLSLEGSWVDWMSFNYTAPRLFTDMEAVGTSNRFYRAVSP